MSCRLNCNKTSNIRVAESKIKGEEIDIIWFHTESLHLITFLIDSCWEKRTEADDDIIMEELLYLSFIINGY